MSNTVRIKRRASGSPGAPTSLANAELAFNEVDNVLYYGKGTGGAGGTATTVDAIGGSGAFVALSGTQTITGNKTFSGSNDLGSSTVATTQTLSDSSTKVATTAFIKGQGYQTGNQSITVSGDASGSGTTAISLTLASVGTAGTYTKVTTDAKGRVTSGTTLSDTDIPTLTASKISDFDTQVRTSRLDQMAAPTASVSLNSQKITNLADPVSAQDAASKAYVDTVAQGLDAKASVKAATTANITLSGTQTVDGVALVASDRVLVKNQSTTSENGVYVVAAGAWTRATDVDTWAELVSAFTFVEEGSTQADTGWVCTVNAGGTLGSTAVTWTQFNGAGTITAGTGLTQNGNTISVSLVPVANGGTGATTLTGYVYGNGTSTMTASATIPGSDISGNISGNAANVTGTVAVANGGTGATTLTGLVKGNGTSAFTAAVANTDYQAVITATGILKGAGSGSISAAVDGTDYLSPSATIDGGTF